MTVKEWLSRYKTAWKEAEDVEQRLTHIRLKYARPSAIVYSDMPKAHNQSDLSDYAAQVERFETILVGKYSKCIGIEIETYQMIDKLQKAEERKVLREYYIDGRKWQDIANDIPCVLRSVHRIHGRALQHMREILIENGVDIR